MHLETKENISKNNIYICSFANIYLIPALKRFYNQASDMNIFTDIFLYNEFNFSKDFNDTFKHKLNYNVRGFGYWCWRPYIILESLKKIEYNDILFYADIGCHFNKKYIEKMKSYIEDVKKYDLLAIELSELADKKYIKADLFDYFNVLDNKNITDSNTRCATCIIMKKTDKNIELINDWLKVFKYNFHLADDTPSIIENFKDFIENRHDQSIFSILSKLYGAKAIVNFEDGKEPINFTRDKICIYHNIISKIAWLIPFKTLRWKAKIILFNKGAKIFYEKLEKLSIQK